MAAQFDNVNIGDEVTIRYSKDGGLSKEYVGTVEGFKPGLVTIKTANGFRSLKFDKMTMVSI